MSATPQSDPHSSQPLSDEQLIQAHEHILAEKVDDGGNYRVLPLVLLFVLGGLIFYGGTYLNLFSGRFNPTVFDPRQQGPVAAAGSDKPRDAYAIGQRLYGTLCIQCHQANGQGLAPVFPPLAKSDWVTGSEERLIRIVLHGLTGPVNVNGTTYGAAPMPPAGPTGTGWSDDKIADVLTYIRGNKEWGNEAGPITVEQVRKVREAEGPRKEWTAAELEKFQ